MKDYGIETTTSGTLQPEIYGYKACWLAWLRKEGFNVPEVVFLPSTATSTKELLTSRLFQTFLSSLEAPDETYDLAVRSSATIEDSESGSLAGHFLSVLGRMDIDELRRNIERVRESLHLHSVRDSSMGVVVH